MISTRTCLLAATFWFTLVPAQAQRLFFGVAAGTGLTSDFPATDVSSPADEFGNPANRFQFLSGPRSLILGAMVEGRISDGLSVEANALHRPMKSTVVFTQFPAGGGSSVLRNDYTEVEAWEFPVMLKYTRGRVFAEAGPAFRTQQNAMAAEPSRFGISAGAGMILRVGRFQITPTLRYTRWQHESIAPKYVTKSDQVELLTGIAYGTDSESRRVGGRKIELGAIVGLPLTARFRSTQYYPVDERASYLAGFATQVSVAGRIWIEGDAIYKPLLGTNPPFSVLTWQFPVLAKYRWVAGKWRPFAEAGPSFRLAGNLNGYNPSRVGATAGAGVERRWRGLGLAPAVRYTRWTTDADYYHVPPGYHYYYARTNTNAVEVVAGVTF
jgi:hypothetical protein